MKPISEEKVVKIFNLIRGLKANEVNLDDYLKDSDIEVADFASIVFTYKKALPPNDFILWIEAMEVEFPKMMAGFGISTERFNELVSSDGKDKPEKVKEKTKAKAKVKKPKVNFNFDSALENTILAVITLWEETAPTKRFGTVNLDNYRISLTFSRSATFALIISEKDSTDPSKAILYQVSPSLEGLIDKCDMFLESMMSKIAEKIYKSTPTSIHMVN